MTEAEQETTMTWDSEQKRVRIFSARPRDQGILSRAGVKPSKGTKSQGFFYDVPLARFRWGVRRVGAKRVLPANHPFLRPKDG